MGAKEREKQDDPALARTLASGDALAPTAAADTIPRTHVPGTDVASADPALAATVTPEVASTSAGRVTSTLTAEHPGRYLRQSELGRGGMGRVLVVKDTHLGRDVALKELLDQNVPGGDAMSVGSAARFLREARITGQLEHPGIVPVHELGQRADGTIYYTMKRIRGRSLASVLKDKVTLAERLPLLAVFRNVCEAVAYAHSCGVVHRDLKPDNIMVGEFGDTLVVDWGLAKVRGEAEIVADRISGQSGRDSAVDDLARTLDGHAIGTPAYMSPEQARGELGSIDERADVWGLGTILFEILVGRPPYVGTSALDVLAKVLDTPPPRVREVAPDAPAELAAICDRALMRDATSRYPNAGAVAKEIGAYLDGRTVGAYEYSAYELMMRFVRRHRAASSAALAVLLSIVVTSVVVTRSFLDEARARAIAEAARDDAMEQRRSAMDSMHAAESAVADALLERAERALAEGDTSGAAIFAAGVLVHDASAPEVSVARRHVRALSLYVQADGERRYAFERIVGSAHVRAALSDDGRTLVIPTENDVRCIRLDDGSERRVAIRARRVRAVSAQGIAVVDGTTSGLYDLETGALVAETPGMTSAAVSGDRIAVSSDDGSVRIWSGDGHTEIAHVTTARRGQLRVAVSADAMAVLSTDVAEVDLWSLASGAPTGPTTVPLPALASSLVFGPRGDRVGVLAGDGVDIVDVGPPPTHREIATDSWPTAMVWSDDGTLALYEWPDRVSVRESGAGATLDVLHMPDVYGGRILGGGSRMVFLPNDIHGSGLLDAATYVRVQGGGRDEAAFPAGVRVVINDPTRHRVLATTLSEVWSISVLASGRLGAAARLFQLPDGVGIVELAALASNGTIAVQTPRGALVLAQPPEYVPEIVRPARMEAGVVLSLAGLALSPDGTVALSGSGSDGHLLRWSVRDHREDTPLAGHTSVVRAIAISPDGARTATGARDGSIHIASLGSGTVEHTLDGHDVAIAALSFAPTSDRLAAADESGQLRVIDVRDGHVIVSGRPHERWINGLSWSSDGRWIVTASDDHTAAVVSASDLEPVRIVRTSTAPITAMLAADGSHVLVPDGRTVRRIDLRMTLDDPDPAVLLQQAEDRAGARLDGLRLTGR